MTYPQTIQREILRIRIPRGEAGVWRTVVEMKKLARAESRLPLVVRTARRLTQFLPPTQDEGRAGVVLGWISQHLHFRPDPADVEWIGTPSLHLTQIQNSGYSLGDCDDGATLSAALLLALGRRVRFVVASFRSDGVLHHVWTETLEGGRWVPIDPFRTERFNRRATAAVPIAV